MIAKWYMKMHTGSRLNLSGAVQTTQHLGSLWWKEVKKIDIYHQSWIGIARRQRDQAGANERKKNSKFFERNHAGSMTRTPLYMLGTQIVKSDYETKAKREQSRYNRRWCIENLVKDISTLKISKSRSFRKQKIMLNDLPAVECIVLNYRKSFYCLYL